MDVLADHLYFALRLVPNFVAKLCGIRRADFRSLLCSRLVTLVTNSVSRSRDLVVSLWVATTHEGRIRSLTKRSAHSSRLYLMTRSCASKRKRALSSPVRLPASRHVVKSVWTNNLNNRRQLSKKTSFELSEAQNVKSPLKYHSKRRWVEWSPPSETREGL